MIERIGEAPPRTLARIAGILYLLDILTSLLGDSLAGRTRVVPGNAAATAASIIAHQPLLRLGVAANLFATACYAAVTVLFYALFKVVNKSLAWLVMVTSLAAVFGAYCLLIGYLIVKSAFQPRVLGILMTLGGIGLLTYLSPSLARDLYPYNAAPALVAETSLMLWLLVKGVNVQQRKQWASAAR